MFGREEELKYLLDRSAAHRVVTVVGPGGIGKTRLVVELAHELARRRQRIGFVELADVQEPREVVDAIADQLAVEVVPGASRYEGLLHRLGPEPTLLVLDNFERVVDAAPELLALVDECPGLRVVTTSRRALAVADEVVIRLSPLAATGPDGPASAPGVQLLLEHTHRAQPTPVDVDAARRIVSGLGGLPLAIELAAFRARSLDLVTVHELLVADVALSGLEGRGELTPRHSCLRACLEWTHDDLDPTARAVFAATGAFSGTFDVAALRAIVGDRRVAAAGLATLVEHHLVDRIESTVGPARYRSIPPIREYAREQLSTAPDREAILDAHARHYLTVAAELRDTFERGRVERAFAAFRRDRPNLIAASLHLLRAGRHDEAAQMVCDVGELATEFGREDRLCEWFRVLSRRAADDGVDLPYEARAWAAYGELVARTPGTAATALTELQRVVDGARAAQDDQAVLRGLDRLTFSVFAHGDIQLALAASKEATDVAARLGQRWRLAQLLTWHAMLLHTTGDIPQACHVGFEAMRVARELDDARLVVRVGLLFAPMQRTAAMDAEHVPSLETCLELARAHGSVIDEMYVTMQMAVRAGFEGRASALDLARRGLELADRTRSHGGELVFVLALAGAAFTRGDDEIGALLDAGLRPEWPALIAVMPAGALERYDDIVRRRRALAERSEQTTDSSEVIWSKVLAAAGRYAASGGSDAATVPEAPRLTAREREVLRELVAGGTNKEIASTLGLKPKTVMHHCASIYSKLGVRSRSEAIALALRTGLIGRD
jgi:predicted ATPase/DNA-binding CsgD family transcriptional regulator